MSRDATEKEQEGEALRSVVVNIVMTATDDADKPQVSHQVLINGQPVQVAIAFVAAGELPIAITNGTEADLMTASALANQASNLGAQLNGRVVTSLVRALGQQAVTLHGLQEQKSPADAKPKGSRSRSTAAPIP